jgi:3-hydroxybutyryl-CoA dehydratase
MARPAAPSAPARAVADTAGGGGASLAGLVNQQVRFRKTVGESDVYQFAGITGDLHPNHVDEAYMRGTPYGRRIVHGALLIGFMSTTSTLMTHRVEVPPSQAVVSYGYDRIRFIRPVHIGDTITVDYRIARADEAARKLFADVTITNERGELCCAGTHILKIVESRSPGAERRRSRPRPRG